MMSTIYLKVALYFFSVFNFQSADHIALWVLFSLVFNFQSVCHNALWDFFFPFQFHLETKCIIKEFCSKA